MGHVIVEHVTTLPIFRYWLQSAVRLLHNCYTKVWTKSCFSCFNCKYKIQLIARHCSELRKVLTSQPSPVPVVCVQPRGSGTFPCAGAVLHPAASGWIIISFPDLPKISLSSHFQGILQVQPATNIHDLLMTTEIPGG